MNVQTVNAFLMQTLGFSADDLAANRKGSLTDAQRERYKTSSAQGTRAMLMIAGFVIVVVLAVIVYILLGTAGIVTLPEGTFGSEPLLVVGVLSLILVYYVIMVVFRARRIGSGSLKVRALTGRVKVSAHSAPYGSSASIALRATGQPTVTYHIKVGRETIYSGDPAVEAAFQQDGTYRIYVVGNKPGYVLVSAEAVSAG